MSLPAQANITSWECANDGDGAIDCNASWDSNTYELTIEGNQFSSPGHMVGSFTTDSELDPNVKVTNSVDNDTTFTWTDYHINLYMNKTFTLSSVQAVDPNDWTYNVVQPLGTPSAIYDAHGNPWSYVGTVNFYAGTPVPNDDSTLTFSYKMSFLGSIAFEQEMIPTPEPATLTLLALGGLALMRRRRA
jgi:hypothetical protein